MNSVQIMHWKIYEWAGLGARYRDTDERVEGILNFETVLLTDGDRNDDQKLPYKLEGYHSVSWDIETACIGTKMRLGAARSQVRVRASLGSGKVARGKCSYEMKEYLIAYQKEGNGKLGPRGVGRSLIFPGWGDGPTDVDN
jgi:hypothetical protein